MRAGEAPARAMSITIPTGRAKLLQGGGSFISLWPLLPCYSL